jgi:hypothetical protein
MGYKVRGRNVEEGDKAVKNFVDSGFKTLLRFFRRARRLA